MDNNLKNTISIREKIYTTRNMQVMIDSDLADLYEVETRVFNQAIKRNIERFPYRFRFQLTHDEFVSLKKQITISGGTDKSLRSQIVILETGGRGQHRKYLPYVFTEQGVAMLSSVLKSRTAIEVSIRIIDTFVEMRKFFNQNANLLNRIEKTERRQISFESETGKNFEKVFKALEEKTDIPNQGIFFDGQVYDAYSFASKLIRKAVKSLILIDNFPDDSVLTLFTKRNVGVSADIYTKNISKSLLLDLDKHNQQYPPIKLHKFTKAHDRFLIIDGVNLYHLGASLKDLGKKWFAFTKLEIDPMVILEKLKVGNENQGELLPNEAVG